MRRFAHRFIEGLRALSAHPAARVFYAVLVGSAGAWLAVAMWGGTSGDFGLISVRASLRPSPAGATVVEIPPFGSISARTHDSPIRLNLQVEQVHISETIRWLRDQRTREEITAVVQGQMRELGRRLAAVTFWLALAGALAASLLLVRGWRYKPVGALAGVLAVAVPLALAVHSYNVEAFRSPRYEGEISRAPYLLDTAQQVWKRYSTAVDLLPRVTERVAGLYKELERGALPQPQDERRYTQALLISDLHNNPVAMRFALSLSRSYHADMVLVTGDISDFGSPLEAETLTAWREFRPPIVAITGNHDSPEIVQALASIPRAKVLENGDVVKRGGISIMGFGDPAAARGGLGAAKYKPGEIDGLARSIRARLAETDPPDVLMVHNFRAASALAGRAPLILTGHSHSPGIRHVKGSVIINPGTTGAAGVRYLSEPKQPAYTAAVLHFAPGEPKPELRMVDIITMRQPSGDFAISRINLGNGDGHSGGR